MHDAAPPSPRLPDGFIDRGAGVTRIEAFVDAAFAFAVTLLVISLDAIPSSIAAMLEALKGAPAFAASFAQIMLIWSAHVRWSRRFGLDDARSQRLSLVLVFLVLMYVYPLKILFGAFFSWVSVGWLPAVAPLDTIADLRTMFVLYGVAFATLSICMAALYRHALRAAVLPPLEPAERAQTRGEIAGWCYATAVALVAIGAALALPDNPPSWLTGMPGLVYLLVVFNGAVARRVAARSP